MDNFLLLIIVCIAIVLCLAIVNCINNQKEKFINHGGYFLLKKDKETEHHLKNTEKLKQSEYIAFSKTENDKLKKICKKLIEKMNKDLKLNFHFVEIDYISKKEISKDINRYLVETFVFESRYIYNRRILFDIFIDSKNKNIKLNSLSVLNADKIKNKKLELYNFEKKILGNHFEKNGNVLGQNDSKLEFNVLNYKPKHFNEKNFKEWILPKEYLSIMNKYSWPCRNQEDKWDENGVNLTEKPNKNCTGINSSFTKSDEKKNINIPKFLPNFKNIDGNSDLNWLFGKFKTDGRNPFMGGRG